ncbi:MAG: DUF3754 domain-containing protein [Verrucomicrobia bacterium]|nr:DUF3754 domain-containing protein [Verrucomicrobiota bacterium]
MSPQPASPSTSNPVKGEAFIPFLRRELLRICLEDGRLTPADQDRFGRFCEMFAAYTHFLFHRKAEDFKSNYWCFNPDHEGRSCGEMPPEELGKAAGAVVSSFSELAELANYHQVSREELERSFKDSTLVELATDVDLDDFERVATFARGGSRRKIKVPRMFREVEIEAEFWDCVILLLHFKGEDHFVTAKHRKAGTKPDLRFKPGKIYTYHYKDVPKSDLELLFPNVRISMTNKDKLMMSVPAIGAGAAVLAKVGGQFVLLIVAVALAMGWNWLRHQIDPLEQHNSVQALAALSAVFTIVLALAGFAFKQWNTYKNKRNNFLKLVAENLFYRNLATNQSVFSRLLDSAEEEECKEAMLVFYHLLANPGPAVTAAELDATIEAWMRGKFGSVVDFDIQGPIDHLGRIQGRDRSGKMTPLLTVDEAGRLQIPGLDDALHILDDLWDTAYGYNQAPPA